MVLELWLDGGGRRCVRPPEHLVLTDALRFQYEYESVKKKSDRLIARKSYLLSMAEIKENRDSGK